MVTGWRLGYIYFHDPAEKIPDLKDAIIRTARVRLCASTPAQKAAVVGLEGSQEHITKMMAKLRTRRDLAHKRLNELEGLSCTKPEGAFYVFPRILDRKGLKDDRDFVINLLESGVLVIHGSGFGEPGRDHFRLVYLAPPETLNKALDRIEAFMRKS
jgi:aspartate/methionine/tyrosine aminotransferase